MEENSLDGIRIFGISKVHLQIAICCTVNIIGVSFALLNAS